MSIVYDSLALFLECRNRHARQYIMSCDTCCTYRIVSFCKLHTLVDSTGLI